MNNSKKIVCGGNKESFVEFLNNNLDKDVKDLWEMLDISKSVFYKNLREHGLVLSDFPRSFIIVANVKYDKKEFINICKMFDNNHKLIAEHLKYNKSSVKIAMKKLNIESTYVAGSHLVNYDKELEDYINGKSCIEIFDYDTTKISHFVEYYKRGLKNNKFKEVNNNYSKEYCIKLLNNIDLTGRGFTKKIEQDPNLYNSINSFIPDDGVNKQKGLKFKHKPDFIEKVYKLLNPNVNNICETHGKMFRFNSMKDGYTQGCESCHKRGFSLVSQELFREVHKRWGKECRYAEHGKELYIDTRSHKDEYNLKSSYYLDFSTPCKKNIEFDGEYWHKETKDADIDRDKYLTEVRGYSVLRISESEYYENKEKVINICLDYLNK